MALSAQVIKLLNDFADSQPALQLPGQPYGLSNPKLGDVLDAALEAAAGSSSASDASDSADAAEASAIAAAESASDASDFADAAAASASYTPAVTGDWVGADPATAAEALDRIAAALGPIA